jgi:hypothetical protein
MSFMAMGIIMKFITFDPDKQYSRLDATLKKQLCLHPVTQSLTLEQ